MVDASKLSFKLYKSQLCTLTPSHQPHMMPSKVLFQICWTLDAFPYWCKCIH